MSESLRMERDYHILREILITTKDYSIHQAIC
jgi:hypothetical protein